MRRRCGGGGLVKHAISALLAEVAEDKIRLEQRDHALFEAMSQGVICLDSSAHILLVNTAARSMLGLTWAEVYNPTTLEARLMPVRADGSPFPSEEYPARVAWRTGEVVSGVLMGIFHQEVQAYRWIDVKAIPLFRSGEPEPYQVIVILQDQTEMKCLRETLETIQAMSAFHLAGENDPPALPALSYGGSRQAGDDKAISSSRYLMGCQYFIVVRLEGEAVIMRPLFVWGPSIEQKARWLQYLDGQSLQTFLCDPTRLEQLMTGNMLSRDLPLPPEAGSDFHISGPCIVVPVLAEQNLVGLLLFHYPLYGATRGEHYQDLLPIVTKMASLMIACQNVTHERDQALVALKDAHAELERVNAIKSDFVAMMNNEFRSALLTIQGTSATIRDSDLRLAEAREFAVDIYADAQHMLHMIADQLALSCLETGRQRLQQGWLNLNTIITDVVNLLRPTTHHLIRLQLARALPILMGDHEKLTSIVSHLLKNAVQFSPDGGEICVSSMVEGHMVHICVRDQGVGIPAFELEKIFADQTRSEIEALEQRSQGLSAIREIVQMHGGELWAESSLGTGSAFHFTIPFTDHHS
jgi:signal transduction histidine kinase